MLAAVGGAELAGGSMGKAVVNCGSQICKHAMWSTAAPSRGETDCAAECLPVTASVGAALGHSLCI